MVNQYDPFEDNDTYSDWNAKPFQFLDKTEDKEEWLKKDIQAKMQEASQRHLAYRRNLAYYKGVQHNEIRRRDGTDVEAGRQPRCSVNFVGEMVDAKVAKLMQTKPAVSYIPNNDEWTDIVKAKTMKALADTRMSEMNIDKYLINIFKSTFCLGHSWLKVYFDKTKGPIAPAYKELSKMNPEMIKKYKGPIKVGDACVNVVTPIYGYPQLFRKCWENVDDFSEVEFVDIPELEKRYPNMKGRFQGEELDIYDYDLIDMKKKVNQAMIVHYYHRKTEFLPEGAYIRYCMNGILSEEGLGYDHGQLPFIPFTDIDVTDEFWGRPFVNNIIQLQKLHNMAQSSAALNFKIYSLPKWVYAQGSVNSKALNSEGAAIEFRGPIPPKMMQSNPVTQEMIGWQKEIERYIEKQSVVYSTSRGEPPKYVTAAVAMQYLDEQEQQRENTLVVKKNNFIVELYKMFSAVIAQFYTETDGRTVKLLGKDNSYKIKYIKDSDFESSYDVRILNTASLPDTKSGKIQTIVDLNNATQTDPLFKRENIVQMLSLGLDDSFKDKATVSLEAAQSIMEDIINGEQTPDPESCDDLLVHYEFFVKELQSRTFKDKYPTEVKQKIIERIGTIEMLMYERMQKNMFFAQKVSMNEYFPIYFEMQQQIDPMSSSMGMGQNPPADQGSSGGGPIEIQQQQTADQEYDATNEINRGE